MCYWRGYECTARELRTWLGDHRRRVRARTLGPDPRHGLYRAAGSANSSSRPCDRPNVLQHSLCRHGCTARHALWLRPRNTSHDATSPRTSSRSSKEAQSTRETPRKVHKTSRPEYNRHWGSSKSQQPKPTTNNNLGPYTSDRRGNSDSRG